MAEKQTLIEVWAKPDNVRCDTNSIKICSEVGMGSEVQK